MSPSALLRLRPSPFDCYCLATITALAALSWLLLSVSRADTTLADTGG